MDTLFTPAAQNDFENIDFSSLLKTETGKGHVIVLPKIKFSHSMFLKSVYKLNYFDLLADSI